MFSGEMPFFPATLGFSGRNGQIRVFNLFQSDLELGFCLKCVLGSKWLCNMRFPMSFGSVYIFLATGSCKTAGRIEIGFCVAFSMIFVCKSCLNGV